MVARLQGREEAGDATTNDASDKQTPTSRGREGPNDLE